MKTDVKDNVKVNSSTRQARAVEFTKRFVTFPGVPEKA